MEADRMQPPGGNLLTPTPAPLDLFSPCDLEYTHIRVCSCGRRVASGLECTHGAPVVFVHPMVAEQLQRLAAMFSAPLPGRRK